MDKTTQSEPNSCQEQSLNKKLYFPPNLEKQKQSKLESNKCVKEKKADDACRPPRLFYTPKKMFTIFVS